MAPAVVEKRSTEQTCASSGDNLCPDPESDKADKESHLRGLQRVVLEVRQVLREELESRLRRVMTEEMLPLRLDLVQRQQQVQQMQLQEHLRAVKTMLEEHQASMPPQVAPPSVKVSDAEAESKERSRSPSKLSRKVVRSKTRHHTWHHQCCESNGSPSRQLLKLPAESLRSVVRATQQVRSPIRFKEVCHSPSSAAAAAAAASMRSERDTRAGSPCSPKEDASIESRSARSEENEKWKQSWTKQMRARLSSQLGDLGHTKKKNASAVTRSMSKFLVDGSARHKQTLAQMYQAHQPKSRLEECVDSSVFQLIVGMVILANAIFIGVVTDLSMHNASLQPPKGDPKWFQTVNQAFVGVFVAEVLLRIVAKRLDFILGIDWKWNIFDLGLATYSVVEELLSGFSLTYTRLLRGFRMVRVLRVIRVMRLFRELRLMVCSIIQSMVSLSWALMLLLIIMYLFAIIFMHAATLYVQEKEAQHDVRDALQGWFGSVGRSMYSLLLAVTGGEDWFQIVEPLGHISDFYLVLFAFYVLFVVIGVLNVLTSAFVQRACELSHLDRDLAIQSELVSDESFTAEMKSIFEEVDIEGTGCIDWEQFRSFIHNEHVQAYFATQQLDTSDARELFNLLDQDGDDEVCIEEFILGCKKLRGQAKSSDVATLLRENKKFNNKSMKAIRKVEDRLAAICTGFQGLGIVIPDEARWMGSPTSCRSYARSVLSRSRSRATRGRSVDDLDQGITL